MVFCVVSAAVGMFWGYTVILLVPHQQLVNWMLDTFNLL
jgi:hypothetical protein